MPTISMFYGIIVRMLFMDTQQHHVPHLHLEYQDHQAVVSLPDGDLPRKQMRLLQAWVALHEDELMANWALAVRGEPVFPIDPLR